MMSEDASAVAAVDELQGAQFGAGNVQYNAYIGQNVRPTGPVWPRQLGVLPAEADCFQPRQIGADLEALLNPGGATTTLVLTGLGGVGKTQVAAWLARRSWTAGLDLLVWITAGSRDAIVAAYAEAAVAVAACDGGHAERAAGNFLVWLTQCRCRWLVVLDDVADPGHVRGLWPQAGPHGRVVMTTRRRDAALSAQCRRVVQLGLFTPAEADSYLMNKMAGDPDRLVEADRLAADLGYLPLAMAQAAAYVNDRGLSCAGYRRRLADKRRRLVDLAPEADALPDDHRVAFAAAWSLSLELANTLTPSGLAHPMLRLASLLDSNAIPLDVLTSLAARRYLAEERTNPATGERISPDTAGEVAVDEALDAVHCLLRLNLASLDTVDTIDATRSVGVHALVQRATRDELEPQSIRSAAFAAAAALLQTWPDIDSDHALARTLRANTQALGVHASEHLWHTICNPLLLRAGRSLGEAGQASAAARYWEHLCNLAVEYLGVGHPDTLMIRNNLANSHGEAGDPAGALTALDHLRGDILRLLGPDHPDTLVVRSSMARWHAEVSVLTDTATSAVEQVLYDRQRELGPDHPDTIAIRHNLHHWRTAVNGHIPASIAGWVSAATIDRSGLDSERPHTPTTRYDEIDWRETAIGPATAVSAFEQLLHDRLRVLGPDHLHTLATRHNLAYWQGEAGDPIAARTALQQLLADYLRVLGADHPHTLTTGNSLARWTGKAGDPAGALAACTQVLANRLRVLGADHPETLITRGSIARWHAETGNFEAAVTGCEQLLADRIRILGIDHPDTLFTWGNLARFRGQGGDIAGAQAALRHLLTERKRLLGPTHPHTKATQTALAHWQEQATSRKSL